MADDEEAEARAIQNELESQGHVVTAVRDGKKAIETLEAENFECAFIDLMMPYVDGFQVLQWIRNHPTKNRMWVALMTAQANDIDPATRNATGADRLIAKPIDLTKLFPSN